MGVFFELPLTEMDAETIVKALESSKGDRPAEKYEWLLAKKIRHAIDNAKFDARRKEAAKLSAARQRAAAGANHVLTKRQAECLTLVRAGKSARGRIGRHGNASLTGGATARMITTLVEAGMLNEDKTITALGREKLTLWELDHKAFNLDA